MSKDTRVSSIRDTLNLGRSVADMHNRTGLEEAEGATARKVAGVRAACSDTRPGKGTTKPVAPCAAAKAQQRDEIPLMALMLLVCSLSRASADPSTAVCSAEPWCKNACACVKQHKFQRDKSVVFIVHAVW